MISRFRRPQHLRRAILIAAILAVPVAALAQDDPKLDPKVLQPKKKLPEASGKLPKLAADRTRGLDFLFGAL